MILKLVQHSLNTSKLMTWVDSIWMICLAGVFVFLFLTRDKTVEEKKSN
jgi:hypothetical protein